MTKKQQEQQLREELLIEFEYTAPANWTLQKLQAEIDKRRAEQAEEETKQSNTPPPGADNGAAVAAKAQEDAKADADATKAEEDTKAAAVAAKAQEDAKAIALSLLSGKTEVVAAAEGDAKTAGSAFAGQGEAILKPGPNPFVLMVTTLAHEYVDPTARNKRSVRVKGENFYTEKPEDYEGVADIIAELAEDE